MTVNVAILLVTLVLSVFAVILCYFLFMLIKKQRSRLALPSLKQNYNIVDTRLQNRLIGLLAGDRPAAERLVKRTKLQNPGKSENWYWEKAIDDLQRDRR